MGVNLDCVGGAGAFAGMLALTIHSIAALAKLFSEEIEHIDPGPVEAVRATGANLLQVIRYAMIPQIVPPFLAYTLLRWDINMRSATVVGFVAGGGIGFFVVETIRLGAYPPIRRCPVGGGGGDHHSSITSAPAGATTSCATSRVGTPGTRPRAGPNCAEHSILVVLGLVAFLPTAGW